MLFFCDPASPLDIAKKVKFVLNKFESKELELLLDKAEHKAKQENWQSTASAIMTVYQKV